MSAQSAAGQPRQPRGTPIGGEWNAMAGGGAATSLEDPGGLADPYQAHNARAGGSFTYPPVPLNADQHYRYFFEDARVPDTVMHQAACAYNDRRKQDCQYAYETAFAAHSGVDANPFDRDKRRKDHQRRCPHPSAEACAQAAADAEAGRAPMGMHPVDAREIILATRCLETAWLDEEEASRLADDAESFPVRTVRHGILSLRQLRDLYAINQRIPEAVLSPNTLDGATQVVDAIHQMTERLWGAIIDID